jgi:transposase-like protein
MGNYILDSPGVTPYNPGMSTTKERGPQTLMEAVKHYADLNVCHAVMTKIKWPDGIVKCPECTSENVGLIATRRMFKCRECKRQFSVKVGTIFEDSPLGLDKWFVAVWAITNAKNGISSCELARAIGVTQKSAWHMLHRIRHVMHTGSLNKFTGEIESDECYIGGASENMHASRRKARIKARGVAGKEIVQGVLKRDAQCSKVIAKVVPDGKRETLTGTLRDNVVDGSIVYTDTHPAYFRLNDFYLHASIDHAIAYVAGNVHTNGLENFWSLLKRTIGGTYVSVDAPHLGRYVDEQVFRFNERKTNDAGRFALVMPKVVGKRLTYKALIGDESEASLENGEQGGAGPAN